MLVAPRFVYALLLIAAPLSMVVAFSFWAQDYLVLDTSVTFANDRDAWTDPLYRELMQRSVRISVVVTVTTALLAFPIAYFVSFHVGRHKALWLFLNTIPFWTSYLLRVFPWKVILGYNGVFNSALIGLGVIDEPPTFLLYNANAVAITHGPCLGALRDPADLRGPRADRPVVAGGRCKAWWPRPPVTAT